MRFNTLAVAKPTLGVNWSTKQGTKRETSTGSAQERFVEAAVDGDDLSGRLAEAVGHE